MGASISRIPGPPFGPSYLITMTSPSIILSLRTAWSASSSQAKVLALPWKVNPSLPVIFATDPSGAKLPRKILR